MFGLAWAISGALAAVAGMLVATGGAGFSQATTLVALKALPAIVLGGLDSVPGALVGGPIIGLAEAYTKTYQAELFPWAGDNFDQVVPYVVMLVVLLVRPYGLFGTREVERV
jgi:branched-chain amino acid transport system permease protein